MDPSQPFVLKWGIGFDHDFVFLRSEAHQAEKAVASVGAALVVRQDLVHIVAVVSLAGEEAGFSVPSVELPVVSRVSTNMAAHDQENILVFAHKLLPHTVAIIVVGEI